MDVKGYASARMWRLQYTSTCDNETGWQHITENTRETRNQGTGGPPKKSSRTQWAKSSRTQWAKTGFHWYTPRTRRRSHQKTRKHRQRSKKKTCIKREPEELVQTQSRGSISNRRHQIRRNITTSRIQKEQGQHPEKRQQPANERTKQRKGRDRDQAESRLQQCKPSRRQQAKPTNVRRKWWQPRHGNVQSRRRRQGKN